MRGLYQASSSFSGKGSSPFVNSQIIEKTNGSLQLVNPSFGPQTGNNYGLSLYTDHPSNGGTLIVPTNAIDWYVDYFNGVVFIQDFRSDFVPTYARGFIYVGKFAKELITEASSSGGGSALVVKDEGSNITTAASSFDFVGSGVAATNSGNNVTVTVAGGISYSRTAITSTTTASVSSAILGVSGTAAIDIRLPSAGAYTAGQYFTVKDESGAANLKNITIRPSGSQTIDGRELIVLESPFAAVNIYSDGSSKFFVY